MTTHLDVLLIERRPGAGALAAAELEGAGHRVHRCYADPRQSRNPDAPLALLCTAVTHGACPLDEGIDVALVARDGIGVRPSITEQGVTCAVRTGIPVVEDGSDLFDPYGPWLTARVRGDVVATCEQAAEAGYEPLRTEIRQRIGKVLAAAGLDPSSVDLGFRSDGLRLTVVLRGPEVARSVQQALGVRVLDAVRATRRNHGEVDVTYAPAD